MRRLVLPAGLALVALGLGACGIPLSSAPHRLPSSALPAALTQRQPASPQQSPSSTKGQTVFIFLVSSASGLLVQVDRSVSRPATVQKVLYALEEGPFSTEYRLGYESAVSGASHLVAIGPVINGTATVRLDRQYGLLSGETPVEELAQIVWSLTSSNLGVKRVNFVGSNGPVPVEIDTGVFVNRPVTSSDYENLIAALKISR
jgi:hypothetical protein